MTGADQLQGVNGASTHGPGNGPGKHALPTPLLCLQGTVTKVDQKQGRHRIQYDDGLREWLPLHRHRFRWLGPRGRSSGYKASCKVIPAGLFGAGVLPDQIGVVLKAGCPARPAGPAFLYKALLPCAVPSVHLHSL